MNTDPVDEQYFNWLYDQAHRERGEGASVTYAIVSGMMHEITFNDSVPNDDNRSSEGKELRHLFVDETQDFGEWDYVEHEEFLSRPASLFEVLVALCQRCDFQVELGISNWFYVLIQNLGLKEFADNDIATVNRGYIREILTKLNDRTYSPDGKGGLFPLEHPKQDQRTVEIWYQMQAYIIENDMII